MEKRHGFLKYFSLGVLLLMVLFITGCTLFGPGPLPTQPVTDQTKLEPSDPRYVADLLADDELQSIVNDVSQTAVAEDFKVMYEEKFNFKTLADEFDPSKILDILQPHETYIKKIEAFLNDGAKKFYTHPERQNYIVEIQGERKDKIVALAKKVNPDLTEPEKLYMDFRDFSVAYNVLASLYYSYVAATQSEHFSQAWEELQSDSTNTQLVIPKAKEYSRAISLELMKGPLTDFSKVREYITNFLRIGAPDDLLSMADILNPEPFKLVNVNKMLDAVKWSVMSYLEIGAFENNTSIVDNKGYRKDGKESITTLFAKAFETNECFVAKNVLENKLEMPEDLGTLKLNGKVPEKVKDVLEEFNKALPNVGMIELTQEATTNLLFDEYKYKFIYTLDFRKLYKDSIDLRDNNIGIKKAFFDTIFASADAFNGFTQRLANGQLTNEDVSLIINNLPFIVLSIDPNNPSAGVRFQLNNNGNLNDPAAKIEFILYAKYTEVMPKVSSAVKTFVIREGLKQKHEEMLKTDQK